MRSRADGDETIAVLAGLPGGPALLDWFGGRPNFGDAEVLGLTLDRRGPSTLRIAVMSTVSGTDARGFYKHAVITFVLADMVDVALEGFSRQNVIAGLILRRADDRPVHPTQVGVGLALGDHEIELRPCFGAFGTIRATITSVDLVQADVEGRE